jgi:hypothetical protein
MKTRSENLADILNDIVDAIIENGVYDTGIVPMWDADDKFSDCHIMLNAGETYRKVFPLKTAEIFAVAFEEMGAIQDGADHNDAKNLASNLLEVIGAAREMIERRPTMEQVKEEHAQKYLATLN